ncbi:MAG: ABC transporter permease [Pseudomonadota bacterium]|jgi:ABC-type polysaccharide/polyol phosphate export permease
MRLVARKSYIGEIPDTIQDFTEAFRKLPLALNLAFQDILARYRGSVIGPWWITVTSGALVLGIGINYGPLFGRPVSELLPYVAVGIVIWSFFASSISEGGEAFVAGGTMLRQSALPLPLFIIRCVTRNLINFGHQLVIIAAILLWFHIYPRIGSLWAVMGLIVLILNISWAALFLAIISARFRDIPQIVSAGLQFIFFLSPIFWVPNDQMARNPLVADNPFFFSVQSVREPLLQGTMPHQFFTILVPIAAVGWVATLLIYNQTRRRVVHYL